jgi:hypothetical protein
MNIKIEDNEKTDSRTAKAVAICEAARTPTETSLKLNSGRAVI